MAQEHSTGPSGPGGGDLGWFTDGMMVEPFFDAVARLSAGEVSAPVKTQFGWHVIKLMETRIKEKPMLADVKDQLIDEIRQKNYDDHVAKLEKMADIQRRDISVFDPETINNFDLLEK